MDKKLDKLNNIELKERNNFQKVYFREITLQKPNREKIIKARDKWVLAAQKAIALKIVIMIEKDMLKKIVEQIDKNEHTKRT